MGLENVPRCQHVKVNGVQCGSPALRQKRHCYFHERVQYERKLAAEDRSAPRNFGFAILEDANSIQVALMKVIQLLGSGCLEPKTAGLMLYALQTASANLRHAKFEPETPTDVIIDEDTVDLTRLTGPQWSSLDFTEEERGKQKDEIHAELPAPEPGRSTVAVEVLADVAKRREQKRKLPLCSTEDAGDPLATYLLDRVLPGWKDHQNDDHPNGDRPNGDRHNEARQKEARRNEDGRNEDRQNEDRRNEDRRNESSVK